MCEVWAWLAGGASNATTLREIMLAGGVPMGIGIAIWQKRKT